jgi:hypothetical protein
MRVLGIPGFNFFFKFRKKNKFNFFLQNRMFIIAIYILYEFVHRLALHQIIAISDDTSIICFD